MANSIKELTEKADALQSALDAEQEQIKSVIGKLETEIEELKGMIADGGTTEERQALADKLDVTLSDLKATIPDEEPEEDPK